MEEVISIIMSVLLVAIFIGMGPVYEYCSRRAILRIAQGEVRVLDQYDLDRHSLMGSVILDHIKPHVREVCVMRNIVITAGGEGGGSQKTTFTSFLIDTEGDTYDVETSDNQAEVTDFAQALAQRLGVKFTNSSYGRTSYTKFV